MFLFAFIFVIQCDIFECKLICEGFSSFVHICIAVGDPVIKRGVGIPLIDLTLPHVCACPKPS
jgi:hypothetical protein